MSATQRDSPNYDVEVDADELLADLAERAGEHYDRMNERERHHREYVQTDLSRDPTKLSRAQLDALESLGALEAYSNAIAMLQPESEHWKNFRGGDGVDVRGFMKEMSRLCDREDDERNKRAYRENRQAQGAHSAYAKIISVLRDDYGVGWPRLDDVSGTALEEDLP